MPSPESPMALRRLCKRMKMAAYRILVCEQAPTLRGFPAPWTPASAGVTNSPAAGVRLAGNEPQPYGVPPLDSHPTLGCGASARGRGDEKVTPIWAIKEPSDALLSRLVGA